MIALFVCNKELFEFLNAEATEQLNTLYNFWLCCMFRGNSMQAVALNAMFFVQWSGHLQVRLKLC